MKISYFRSRIDGPEIILEDIVLKNIEIITSENDYPYWLAGSPRIGSGMPDILFASYSPEVYALSTLKYSNVNLLAFLRAVKSANIDTIMHRLNYSEKIVNEYLEEFVEIKAIEDNQGFFSLTKPWLNLLPTIITIEVKVHDWKSALNQANRNKIFSHYSYIALPKKTASRISSNALFSDSGIGLLSIEENVVQKERDPESSQPKIWEYYYKLALLLASCINERGNNAVPNSNRRSSKTCS